MSTSVKPKLLEEVRAALRVGQYSWKTEKAYVSWIEKYLRYHRDENYGIWRHPRELREAEVEQYLSYLATEQQVAPSTQEQAFSALIFLEPRAGTQTSGDSGPSGTAQAASPGRAVAGGSTETAAQGLPRAVRANVQTDVRDRHAADGVLPPESQGH